MKKYLFIGIMSVFTSYSAVMAGTPYTAMHDLEHAIQTETDAKGKSAKALQLIRLATTGYNCVDDGALVEAQKKAPFHIEDYAGADEKLATIRALVVSASIMRASTYEVTRFFDAQLKAATQPIQADHVRMVRLVYMYATSYFTNEERPLADEITGYAHFKTSCFSNENELITYLNDIQGYSSLNALCDTVAMIKPTLNLDCPQTLSKAELVQFHRQGGVAIKLKGKFYTLGKDNITRLMAVATDIKPIKLSFKEEGEDPLYRGITGAIEIAGITAPFAILKHGTILALPTS